MFKYNELLNEKYNIENVFKYTICSSITLEDATINSKDIKFKYTICSSITLEKSYVYIKIFVFKYTICSSITHHLIHLI